MLTFDDISKIYNTQNKSGFNSLWEHNSREENSYLKPDKMYK